MGEKDSQIQFKIESDLKKELISLAEKEDRTLSQYIRLVLKEKIASAKKSKKKS
jgi:hypothetical protein